MVLHYHIFLSRLQGITKSISRYPTFRRRFESLVKSLSNELDTNGKQLTIQRSKSAFARMFSQKSFKKTSNDVSDQESQIVARDVEIA
jgi:hypothetical protein